MSHESLSAALRRFGEVRFEPTIPTQTLRRRRTHDGTRPVVPEEGILVRDALGSGTVGVVYSALQTGLGREVAVKGVRPGASVEQVESLIAEARFLGRLEHPNIVPVHALVSSSDGLPLVVMKRADGVDWAVLVNDAHHPGWDHWKGAERDPLARNVELLAEVARAVEIAHQRGIVHCDIKPSNVRLCRDGAVYLMDWGSAVAHPVGDTGSRPRGTAAYLPPELATAERPPTPASDVFLLGACLYEILTGNPPYAADTDEHALLRAAICATPTLPTAAPGALRRSCLAAMVADPDGRTASASALRAELQAWLRGRSTERVLAASLGFLLEVEPALQRGDVRQAYEAIARGRFGVEQVLEAGPRPRAKRALSEALSAICTAERQRGNLDQAKALCDEMAALGTRVDKLRAEIDAEIVARDVLRQRHRDLDVGSDRRRRTVAITLVAATIALVLLPFATGLVVMSSWHSVLLGAFVFVAACLVTAVYWRTAIRSAAARTMAATFVAACLAMLLNRGTGYLADVPLAQSSASDLCILALAAAPTAPMFGRPVFAATFLALGGAVSIAALPGEFAAIHAFTMAAWAILFAVGSGSQPGATNAPTPADAG